MTQGEPIARRVTEKNNFAYLAVALVLLLLGIIWTCLYAMLAEFRQGAFNGPSSGSWYEAFPTLLHFSFVTLTTVGYGDITPVSPLARFLAFMEAIVGQFYIAVLVASPVGGIISKRPN
jgi:hypothetical protein